MPNSIHNVTFFNKISYTPKILQTLHILIP